MEQQVKERMQELLKIVAARHPTFRVPAVAYYDHKLAAGYADYRKHEVSFNTVHLRENLESMLHETVAHELAHLVCFHVHGRSAKAHGYEWQSIMRDWFNVEPSRLHDYDQSNVKAKRQDRWAATCACDKVHRISTTKRNSIIFKGIGYHCLICNQTITLTGESA